MVSAPHGPAYRSLLRPGQFDAHGAHSHHPSSGPYSVLESVNFGMTLGHDCEGLRAGPSRHEIDDEVVAPANPAGDRRARAASSSFDASPSAAALRSAAKPAQSARVRSGLNAARMKSA